MTITELLVQFADKEVMHSLTLSQKLTAGLTVTVLGMGITFLALIILQFVVAFMERFADKPVPRQEAEMSPAPIAADAPKEDPTKDEELVAVIATTLAMKLRTSVDSIVIRSIERVEDRTPAWRRAGMVEQMNSRL